MEPTILFQIPYMGPTHPPQIPDMEPTILLKIPDMGPTILLGYLTWDLPSSSEYQTWDLAPPLSPSPCYWHLVVDMFKPVHLRTYPLPPHSTVLTSNSRQWNTYSWQAGSMHLTGMLSGLCRVETCGNDWSDYPTILASPNANTLYVIYCIFFSWFVHFFHENLIFLITSMFTFILMKITSQLGIC